MRSLTLDNPRKTEILQIGHPTHRTQRIHIDYDLELPGIIQDRDTPVYQHHTVYTPQQDTTLLDASDLNIYKVCRNRQLLTEDQLSCASSLTEAMAEHFKWMEGANDESLDNILDDYHANLADTVIPSSNASHQYRPSYRRNMSVTQSPLGIEKTTEIGLLPETSAPPIPARNTLRTMSLSNPGATKGSPALEATTTYYQDPEARLKLRVYLASPQKFDEAIEFGFPSLEHTDALKRERMSPRKISRETHASDKSFEDRSIQMSSEEDSASCWSHDEASTIDPDSPTTPAEPDDGFRTPLSMKLNSNGHRSSTLNDYSHLGITKPQLHKSADNFLTQATGNREMTLRMTLTRADLRAADEELYGWQKKQVDKENVKLSSLSLDNSMNAKSTYTSNDTNDMMGPYGGVDGWGAEEEDNGVVKRLWRKVRGSHRKTSAIQS